MGWPTPAEINEAVQNPQLCFHDQDLAAGHAETDCLGIPIARSGSSADVYCIACNKENVAIKCFTRPIAHLERRYKAIHDALGRLQLPFTVDFAYETQGIWLRDEWYPLVRMQWVNGLRLNEFARSMIGRPEVLHTLITILARMGDCLDSNRVGHCDLQHGNILLTPSHNGRKLAVRLVDYDGMWVPALDKDAPQEFGHPDYQHPARQKTGYYGPAADRFSLLAIATGLRGLIVHGGELWKRYDNSVNVLFQQKDFVEPLRSPLIEELSRSKDSSLRRLCGALTDACCEPLDKTRPLSAVLNGATYISTGPMSVMAEAVEVVPLPINEEFPVVGVSGDKTESTWDRIFDTNGLVAPTASRPAKSERVSVGEKRPLWGKIRWIVLPLGSLVVGLCVLWLAGAFRGKEPTKEQDPQSAQQSAKTELSTKQPLQAAKQPLQDRKSVLQKARDNYTKTIKEAEKNLVQSFQNVIRDLSTEKNAVLLNVVQTESKRFDKSGLVPWSKPMWPHLLVYLQTFQSAGLQLQTSYETELKKTHTAKDEAAVRDFQAELTQLSYIKALGKWEHHGEMACDTFDFYSNGKFGDRDGTMTWTLEPDSTLILRQPSPDAPGGVWVITVQVSEDGLSYNGSNQLKTKVNGLYLSE